MAAGNGEPTISQAGTLAPAVRAEPPAAPFSFAVGRPTSTAWREQALARVSELKSLTAWLAEQDGVDPRTSPTLQAAIAAHLQAAEMAADGDGRGGPLARLHGWMSGASIERAMSNIESVEADLIRMAPLELLRGAMPSLVVTVQKHLEPNDQRRVRIEKLAALPLDKPLTEVDREAIVRAVRGATSEGRREVTRVRSFRNVLFVTAAMLVVVAALMGFIGLSSPTAIPLCFAPDNVKLVCPTKENAIRVQADPNLPAGQAPEAAPSEIDRVTARTVSKWDIPLIELLGAVAAAVAAAAALRGIRGTSTPYSLPVALALLKLPTGALTAFLGLLLMRGQFVPGLSALDTSAQIIAWAVVFGYAQQLFTRLVDRQAHAVLDDVGGNQPKASAAAGG